MQTVSENQIGGPEEQASLPGMPTLTKGEPDRFLSIPGDVGRYLNVVFAASPDAAARTLTFKTTDPDTGSAMVARVRGFVVDGRHLYTPHLRVFFALFAIMRRTAPDAEGFHHGDFRDLSREVGFKWHAAGTLKKRQSTPRLLAQLCRDLRVNGYYVENVFYDAVTKEWVNRWDDPVNLLQNFSLEVRVAGTGDHEARYSFRFKISEHARRVFLQDSLPVPHQAVRRIDGRNNLAPMLLTFLSTVMTDKTAWDRYTDELLRDDLRYTRTPGRSVDQKRVINRALRYINGAIIPTGTLAATIGASTVDARRNVLHVTKAPFQQTLRFVPASRRVDTRRGPRHAWQRRPTKDEAVKIGDWATELLTFAGDEHSRVFYETAARRFILAGHEQSLFSAIADAKDLDRSGYIQKTRAHALTRNLLEQAERVAVPLRNATTSTSTSPSPTTTPPAPIVDTTPPPRPATVAAPTPEPESTPEERERIRAILRDSIAQLSGKMSAATPPTLIAEPTPPSPLTLEGEQDPAPARPETPGDPNGTGNPA